MPNVDLRARKQARPEGPAPAPTSENGSSRVPLRLVHDSTQTAGDAQGKAAEPTPVGGHTGTIRDAVAHHNVTGTHPPTLADAAMKLWPARDEVRHGLAGQLGAALAGLIQLAGLAACWGAAHALFSSKTRAAVFALVLVTSVAVFAAASHA